MWAKKRQFLSLVCLNRLFCVTQSFCVRFAMVCFLRILVWNSVATKLSRPQNSLDFFGTRVSTNPVRRSEELRGGPRNSVLFRSLIEDTWTVKASFSSGPFPNFFKPLPPLPPPPPPRRFSSVGGYSYTLANSILARSALRENIFHVDFVTHFRSMILSRQRSSHIINIQLHVLNCTEQEQLAL